MPILCPLWSDQLKEVESSTILATNIRTVGIRVDLLTTSEQQIYQNASNIEYDHIGQPPTPANALVSTHRETGGTLK